MPFIPPTVKIVSSKILTFLLRGEDVRGLAYLGVSFVVALSWRRIPVFTPGFIEDEGRYLIEFEISSVVLKSYNVQDKENVISSLVGKN